jgi:hypothetical protein
MRGLIVAALATAAGVAGVVGLSAATDDGSAPPATTVATPTARSDALANQLARVRHAERAADAALARAAAATRPSLQRRGDGSIDDAQPATVTAWSDDGGGGRWHDDGGRGRGLGGDDGWDDD